MERIGVVGLGYVGLPVALAFARAFPEVVGFDIHRGRVAALRDGIDETGEVDPAELKRTTLRFSADPDDLRGCTFFVVAVPTPIDDYRRPDLRPVESASRTVGKVLGPGAVVVFESTVYPGVTEDVCGPILAKESGLRVGVDFALGYSPERINPGDKEHRLETIVKVVSGQDAATLDRVANTYQKILDKPVHRAQSIKVAEAAKVIENTQRDLNIALMNELAIIFERLGIRTRDVLDAAGTKWNFLKFQPGLVGGHCIGVDPYYLTARAEQLGYHPQVILAGRRINDDMGAYVASRVVKSLGRRGKAGRDLRVGVLGVTFKENVPDIRNSRVPDIVRELADYGAAVLVHDPQAHAEHVQHEYGFGLVDWSALRDLDAVVLAVPHRQYLDRIDEIVGLVASEGLVFDIKAVIPPGTPSLGGRELQSL